jgi:hypothetical protein
MAQQYGLAIEQGQITSQPELQLLNTARGVVEESSQTPTVAKARVEVSSPVADMMVVDSRRAGVSGYSHQSMMVDGPPSFPWSQAPNWTAAIDSTLSLQDKQAQLAATWGSRNVKRQLEDANK